MRLIDADALIDAMTGACNIFDAHGVDTTLTRTLITIADKVPTVGGWISVKDRLPENADYPGAFCPRYLVMTKYGRSEGWYNPDKGCWYTLVWFLIGRYTEDDIDMERGDIPKISNNIEVTHWMMFPSAEGLDET